MGVIKSITVANQEEVRAVDRMNWFKRHNVARSFTKNIRHQSQSRWLGFNGCQDASTHASPSYLNSSIKHHPSAMLITTLFISMGLLATRQTLCYLNQIHNPVPIQAHVGDYCWPHSSSFSSTPLTLTLMIHKTCCDVKRNAYLHIKTMVLLCYMYTSGFIQRVGLGFVLISCHGEKDWNNAVTLDGALYHKWSS